MSTLTADDDAEVALADAEDDAGADTVFTKTDKARNEISTWQFRTAPCDQDTNMLDNCCDLQDDAFDTHFSVCGCVTGDCESAYD